MKIIYYKLYKTKCFYRVGLNGAHGFCVCLLPSFKKQMLLFGSESNFTLGKQTILSSQLFYGAFEKLGISISNSTSGSTVMRAEKLHCGPQFAEISNFIQWL